MYQLFYLIGIFKYSFLLPFSLRILRCLRNHKLSCIHLNNDLFSLMSNCGIAVAVWHFTQHVCMVPFSICNLQMLRHYKVRNQSFQLIISTQEGYLIVTDITLKSKEFLTLVHRNLYVEPFSR